MRPLVLIGLLTACQTKSDEPAAAATGGGDPASVVAAVAPDGETMVALSISGSGAGAACEVTGEAEVTIGRDGAATVAKLGQTEILRVERGEIRDADGVSRMRVSVEEHRIDLMTMEGIPVARIAGDADRVTIADAARHIVMTVARAGAAITATGADGAAIASITGTIDPLIAGLLVTPGVPADVRAMLACERLFSVSGPVVSTP